MKRAWLAVLILVAGAAGSGCCCRCNSWFHPFCTNGCGEAYYGDWWCNTPTCCNPCDQCGHWWGRGSNSPYQNNMIGYGYSNGGMMMQGGAVQDQVVEDSAVGDNEQPQPVAEESVAPPPQQPRPMPMNPTSSRPRRPVQRSSWSPSRNKATIYDTPN